MCCRLHAAISSTSYWTRRALAPRFASTSRGGPLLGLLAALLIAPGFVAAGSEFDKGILVTFPTRVLAGQLPYRDFESFYGPANAYLVAGVFEGLRLIARRRACSRLCVSGGDRPRPLLGVAAVRTPCCIRGWCHHNADHGRDRHSARFVRGGSRARGPRDRRRVSHTRATPNPAWLGLVVGLLVRPCMGFSRAETSRLHAGRTHTARVPDATARALHRWARSGSSSDSLPYLPLAVATGLHRLEQETPTHLGATGRDRRLPIVIGVHGDAGHLLLAHLGALALLAGATVIAFRSHAPVREAARFALGLVRVQHHVRPVAFRRASRRHSSHRRARDYSSCSERRGGRGDAETPVALRCPGLLLRAGLFRGDRADPRRP